MGTLKAIITVTMEDGKIETINRTIDVDNLTPAEIDKARQTVLDAWVDYLYRETDIYRIVKSSSITIEEPKKVKGE